MKIVVLDGHTLNPGDIDWKGFEALGELTVYDRTPADQIVKRMGHAEVVLTNKTPLSADTIAACPSLRYIGVLATGYNVVDVDAAQKRNIPVCNIPTYGTAAVAQFTVALLLELCHHIGAHSNSVHAGDWGRCPDWCYWNYPLIELSGKTAGIIGFGRIGQATAKILLAMGMRVLAYDAHEHEEGRILAEYVSLDELLKQSDVISLHCPLFPDTKGLICKKNIDIMKDNVMILNASRGPLVVEADLADALNSGKVSGAALDVASTEPISEESPLLNAKNCILTPHIAWAPKESRQRLMNIAVDNLRSYLSGNIINNVWYTT